jgi:glycosyltransferase involved in cell wall biosynthesis
MKLDPYKPVNSGEREDVVVHIGIRLVKNPQISIEAIKMLRRRGYEVKLVMIGAPISIPSDEVVEFRNGITENEKLELLCRAKALTLPSSYEALPYVTLETMACGTPIAVSNAVPAEVVLNNFSGIRVSSLNPEDYANALEKLLINEELWLKLSRNGLEFVRQFDHVRIAKEYEAMIKKML